MVSRRYEPHRQTVAVLHSILTSAVMASHNTSASPSLAASTLLHHCNRALDDVCLLTDKMNLVSGMILTTPTPTPTPVHRLHHD